jgi:hypothetical protein
MNFLESLLFAADDQISVDLHSCSILPVWAHPRAGGTNREMKQTMRYHASDAPEVVPPGRTADANGTSVLGLPGHRPIARGCAGSTMKQRKGAPRPAAEDRNDETAANRSKSAKPTPAMNSVAISPRARMFLHARDQAWVTRASPELMEDWRLARAEVRLRPIAPLE